MSNHRRHSDDRSQSKSPELPPRKIKPIAATKLQAFSVGTHKKTPYQRHKEENEMKKKKETEEAAKVYAEFVASFEDAHDYKVGTRSFVKSATLVPREAGAEFDPPVKPKQPAPPEPAKSSYKPMPFVKAGEGPKTKIMPLSRTRQQDESEDDDEDDALARKEARAQKKRNLDTFLEEIKKEQEDREDRLKVKQMRTLRPGLPTEPATSSGLTLRAAFEENAGSHDTGDPWTTNLYVGNINPAVNEMMLCQEFAKYGPIASVKIMWPRTQEERERNRNCGFVSFMTRPDAEQALKNLDGKSFHDFIMKVGWGKAVPLPPKPVFVLDAGSKPVQTGLPFNAQMVDTSSKPRLEISVVKPTNMQNVKIIHRMIERVIKHGPAFEAIIMDREKDNVKFRFLFDHMSEEHVYYRWKLYSLLQGDTKSQWRTEPFQMFEGGAWWVPPDVPFDDEGMMDVLLDSEDEEKERERESLPKGVLGKIAKQRFESMLRQISFQRGSIARAMAFAIDHADAADEVIDIIIKALIIPETPLAVKLARLYLVSDILHNSGAHVANAWKYRVGLESRLTCVFEHLNGIYRSISARLKAEQVRRAISNVLSAWEAWMVFPQHHIDHLNGVFMKKAANESESRAVAVETEDVDGEPMEDVDGEPMHDADDVDGEPLDDEDVDGGPMIADEKSDVEINDMFA
ncbi:hypothetical protein BJV82DRAFT_299808 [Fennellomyces sp. T-0311]|nr:hypothetical protein BJV82DRAFT_299808 [Fennellomyces sp. T-0311]